MPDANPVNATHEKPHIDKIDEEQCLVRRIQQNILESTFQSPLTISKVESRVSWPATGA